MDLLTILFIIMFIIYGKSMSSTTKNVTSVECKLNNTCMLPCFANVDQDFVNEATFIVKWSNENTNDVCYLYMFNTNDYNSVDNSYKDRTFVNSTLFADKVFNMTITPTKISDASTYKCYVTLFVESKSFETIVTLTIVTDELVYNVIKINESVTSNNVTTNVGYVHQTNRCIKLFGNLTVIQLIILILHLKV